MSPRKSARQRLSVTHLEDRLVPAGVITEQIIVDQIGWRNDAVKQVVFADPQQGQNAAVTYVPGDTFEVRRESDDSVVFTGDVVPWKGGMLDAVSGDVVSHGDFSTVTETGDYYVYDPTNDLRSYSFRIDPDVYNGVLQAATRVFYYQRSGTEIPEEFGGNWTHGLDHIVERNALLIVGDTPQAGTERDVSGGWWDAGDYNKYVSFTQGPLWDLLSAYEWNPDVFPDTWNIPESGNGRSDIIDLIKWETDWLLKMQLDDGSVLNRVGQETFNVGTTPETDTQPHYYTSATTWATASLAASLAHASRIFEPFDADYATTLRQAAERAWAYLDDHPNMEPANGRDGGNVDAVDGSADKENDGNVANDVGADRRIRILAAAELYRLTGLETYRDYFDANYNSPDLAQGGGFQPLIDGLFDPSLCLDLNRAAVTYALTPGATPAVVDAIKGAAKVGADIVLANQPDDPYLSFMYTGHYTYGSNELKANWGNLLAYARVLEVGTADERAEYRRVGEEYLHYFHGRNPLSQTHLTNLGERGANLGVEKSVMEAYHSWWLDGTPLYDGPNSTFGPAPGYVSGGPNQFYSGQEAPPKGEPPMKTYRDWNTTFDPAKGVEEFSFEINEPAIYTQAAYVLLASQFATAADTPPPPTVPPALFAVGNESGSVQVYEYGLSNPRVEFRPLDSGGGKYTGLVNAAVGDVTGDGTGDLVVAAASPLGDKGLAADKAGRFFVYDGAQLAAGADPNAALLYSHLPFGSAYINGLNVATGDVDGDGEVDFVAGSRGLSGGFGRPEQGRFIVISGPPLEGSDAFLAIGSPTGTPGFGQGYLKGCVVSTADLDGNGGAEVIVTRGGPVVNRSDLKVKAFRLAGAGFDLVSGTEIVPFAGIKRGGKVTALDVDGDGKSEFVISALDPTTHRVLIKVYNGTGAEVVSTSFVGPSGGTGDVADYAISARAANAAEEARLVLAIDNATAGDGVYFLSPLTGRVNILLDEFALPPFALNPGGVSVGGV